MFIPHISSADDLFGILVVTLLFASIAFTQARRARRAQREHERRRLQDRRGNAYIFEDWEAGIEERRTGERRKASRRGQKRD
jgi:hypothetical protein